MHDATAAPWPKLRAPTLVDQVYEELKRLIADGRLAPGQDVVVATVAAEMQVSRAPVRDACNLLVGAGLLTKRQHASYRVRSWTEDDLREMNLIRWGYESAAVRFLVEEDLPLRGADEALDRMTEAARVGSAAESMQSDMAFHQALVHSTGLSELSALHAQIAEKSLLVPIPPDLPAFVLDGQRARHQRIVDALAAARACGDPTGAVAALTEHMQTYKTLVAKEQGSKDSSANDAA